MTTSKRLPWSTAGRLAALLAVLVVLVACGGAASGPQGVTGDAASGAGGKDTSGANPPELPAGAPVGEGTSDGAPVLDASRADLLIIKTGSLELQVKAVNDAVTAAAAKITALDGYVSGSEQFGEGEDVTATITYRIPADRWEEALAALRALAIKVVSEQTGTQDVTGQVVDLRARITNLRATETALQGIMTQATKISDILAVQAELTTVRGQIEEATAQKQHLEGLAAFSTLTVRFGLQPEAAVITAQEKFDPGSEVDRATASLVEVLQGLATAGIWFAIVWLPILLVVAFVGLILFVVMRRLRPAGRTARVRVSPGEESPIPPPPTAG
jgi:cell division protein FtsL